MAYPWPLPAVEIYAGTSYFRSELPIAQPSLAPLYLHSPSVKVCYPVLEVFQTLPYSHHSLHHQFLGRFSSSLLSPHHWLDLPVCTLLIREYCQDCWVYQKTGLLSIRYINVSNKIVYIVFNILMLLNFSFICWIVDSERRWQLSRLCQFLKLLVRHGQDEVTCMLSSHYQT